MKRKIKYIIISVVVAFITFSVWINFAGLGNSAFSSSVNRVEEYIESENRFPENLAELEKFHERKMTAIKINQVDIDKIIVKDGKLYLDGKKVWLVKPSGQYIFWINVLMPAMTTAYSHDVYEKYMAAKIVQ
jgi:hypothetical protein